MLTSTFYILGCLRIDGPSEKFFTRLVFACFLSFLQEKLAGGQKWAAEIQQSILNAHAIIVVCTPTYGETTWTYRELQLADNHVSECTRRLRGGTKEAKRLFDRMTCNFRQTKPIIPLWHSGVYPPKAVEIFFSGLQRVPAGDRPLVDLRARHQNGRNAPFCRHGTQIEVIDEGLVLWFPAFPLLRHVQAFLVVSLQIRMKVPPFSCTHGM